MDFCDLNYCELTFSITALANSLAKDLDNEEVLLLSKVFSELSHTLSTIATIRAYCTKKQSTAKKSETEDDNK